MDELALLKEFRAGDAAPGQAREHARRALNAAVRRGRQRRRTVLALALAAAVVLPAAAYGVVKQLAPGDPAPPEIKTALAQFRHWAELIPTPRPDDPVIAEAKVAA